MSHATEENTGWGAVVAVVITEYDDRELTSLPALRDEVTRLRELFVDTGFRRAEVDFNTAADTAQAVRDALDCWRPEVRRLVVYWGGHGGEVQRIREGNRYYLYCRDTDGRRGPDDRGALSASDLGERLARLGVAEVVLFVDACGAGSGGDEIAAAFKEVVAGQRRQGWRFRPSLAVISSSSGYEKAAETAFSAAVSMVLRHGAPPDESYLPWTDRDSHISPAQLTRALQVVLERGQGPVRQLPDFVSTGPIDKFFPNPRYRGTIPDVDLEAGQRGALGSSRALPENVADHFMVKFRGIDSANDQGWYFTGRHRVLRRLVGWLDSGAGMLVVTGGPGCGKSALLGRLAVLSVPGYRELADRNGALDGVPPDTLPRLGSIDAGIHAKHRSLLDCVADLAEALGISAPRGGWQAPAELLLRIAERPGPTTVLLDALDEAPLAEIHSLATDLLRPLAELPRVRVLVGTRPQGGGHELLGVLAVAETAAIFLDRDSDRAADIEAYVASRLVGPDGSPYRGRPSAVHRTAVRIAAHSDGVFLFARLLAGLLARRAEITDLDSREAEELLGGEINDALTAEMRRFGADEAAVRALLAPLAWAEGLGLPGREVWLAVANALARVTGSGARYGEADLVWLIGRAGSHIVVSGEAEQTVYRLYHQSYNDFFRAELAAGGLGDAVAQAAISEALVALIERDGVRHWRSANPYLLRHMPAHAVSSGWLARLCADPDFLVFVEPQRLQRVLGTLDHRDLPLVRLYWRALAELPGTTPEQRVDIFGAVALREEPAAIPLLRSAVQRPWSPLWSYGRPVVLHRPLGRHGMPAHAVEFGYVGGRPVLVSAAGDHTVRLWDPVTGERRGTFIGHKAPLLAVALTTVAGRGTVVSGDGQGVLHVWDIATGQSVATQHTRRGAVLSLVVVPGRDGEQFVCVGDDSGAIRVRRLTNQAPVAELTDHHAAIRSLSVLADQSAAPLLLSGGDDGRVRLWDTRTWRSDGEISTAGTPLAIAATRVQGQLVLAVGGRSGQVSVWALRERRILRLLPSQLGTISSVAFGTLDGRTVLAAASEDGAVLVWDPVTGEPLRQMRARPPIRHAVMPDRLSLLVGPAGGTVASEDEPDGRATVPGQSGPAVHVVRFAAVDSSPELVTAGADGVIRLWDIRSASRTLVTSTVPVESLAAGMAGSTPIVAAGHRDGAVTVREAATGIILWTGRHGDGPVRCVLVSSIHGRSCVVSGGADGVLRCWDARTGASVGPTVRNPGHPVNGACLVRTGDHQLLAHTVGGAIQLTDPRTGEARQIPAGGHAPVSLTTVSGAEDLLVLGYRSGRVIVMRTNGDQFDEVHHDGLTAAPVGLVARGRIRLAAIHEGNQIRVTDLDATAESGTRLRQGPKHNTRILAMAYGNLADGTLAVGGADGSVTLSDPLTGAHRTDLPSHFAAVTSLAFGTGGNALFTAGEDGIQAIGFTR